MNIGVHMSLSDLVSLVCMPRSGIAAGTTTIQHSFGSVGQAIRAEKEIKGKEEVKLSLQMT